MSHRHIEAVDLTADDDDEAAPLTLAEEDHSAAQLTALDDGSVVLEDVFVAERPTAPMAPLLTDCTAVWLSQSLLELLDTHARLHDCEKCTVCMEFLPAACLIPKYRPTYSINVLTLDKVRVSS